MLLSPFDPSKVVANNSPGSGRTVHFSTPSGIRPLEWCCGQGCCFPSAETLADTIDKEPPPVKPENVAYVLYTSGSTGKPESIVIEHRALRTSISIICLGKASEYSI